MYLRGDEIPTSHMPVDGVIPLNTGKLEKGLLLQSAKMVTEIVSNVTNVL